MSECFKYYISGVEMSFSEKKILSRHLLIPFSVADAAELRIEIFVMWFFMFWHRPSSIVFYKVIKLILHFLHTFTTIIWLKLRTLYLICIFSNFLAYVIRKDNLSNYFLFDINLLKLDKTTKQSLFCLSVYLEFYTYAT